MHDLRKLENDLWEAPDQLRTNSKLTAGEYSMPVLGLIFLRQATNRFYEVKAAIEALLPRRTPSACQNAARHCTKGGHPG
jgi:type I restriction enzyme M protein